MLCSVDAFNRVAHMNGGKVVETCNSNRGLGSMQAKRRKRWEVGNNKTADVKDLLPISLLLTICISKNTYLLHIPAGLSFVSR